MKIDYLHFILRTKQNLISSVVKHADIINNMSDLHDSRLKDKYRLANIY